MSVQSKEDFELGVKVVQVMVIALNAAIFAASWVWLGFWLALLISFLASIAVKLALGCVSDENCEALGRKVGSALGSVRGFFTRKAA